MSQLRDYEKRLRGSITLSEDDTGPSAQQKLRTLMKGMAKSNTDPRFDLENSVSDSSDLAASAPSRFSPPPMLHSTTRHSGTLINQWLQFRNRKAAAEESASMDTDTEEASARYESCTQPHSAGKPTNTYPRPASALAIRSLSSETGKLQTQPQPLTHAKPLESGSPSTSSNKLTPNLKKKKKKKVTTTTTASASTSTSTSNPKPKPAEVRFSLSRLLQSSSSSSTWR